MHLQLCLLFLALALAKPLADLALTANLAWHLAASSGGVTLPWPSGYRPGSLSKRTSTLPSIVSLLFVEVVGGWGVAVAKGSPALQRFRF